MQWSNVPLPTLEVNNSITRPHEESTKYTKECKFIDMISTINCNIFLDKR